MELKRLKYLFNENIIFKTVKSSDGDVLVIAHNPETGDMYEFNSVGSELFNLLRSNLAIEDIVHTLSEEYDVQIGVIYDDIAPFIERFIELGMIDIIEEETQCAE